MTGLVLGLVGAFAMGWISGYVYSRLTLYNTGGLLYRIARWLS